MDNLQKIAAYYNGNKGLIVYKKDKEFIVERTLGTETIKLFSINTMENALKVWHGMIENEV